MSRTVTALYDTRQEAEAARQRLGSAVDVDCVKIIDQNSGEGGNGRTLDNLYLSNDDRHAYGEGLRRGGFLLCAEVESGEDHERIVQLLEESASVDLEERQQSWTSEGWQAFSGAPTASAESGMTSQSTTGLNTTGQDMTAGGNVVEEQRIPIVEEELRVGKREVTGGGARVRSYVRETPVEEQVTLREEHVSVERRPVPQQQQQQQGVQSTQNAEDLLQDREIEMRETSEEAVVQKVANVREELVVRKTAEDHVEQVRDTVRHTEVDVEEGAGDRSAFGSFAGGEDRTTASDSEKSDFERDRSR